MPLPEDGRENVEFAQVAYRVLEDLNAYEGNPAAPDEVYNGIAKLGENQWKSNSIKVNLNQWALNPFAGLGRSENGSFFIKRRRRIPEEYSAVARLAIRIVGHTKHKQHNSMLVLDGLRDYLEERFPSKVQGTTAEERGGEFGVRVTASSEEHGILENNNGFGSIDVMKGEFEVQFVPFADNIKVNYRVAFPGLREKLAQKGWNVRQVEVAFNGHIAQRFLLV